MLTGAYDAAPLAERGGCVPRLQSSVWITGDGVLEVDEGEHVAAVATER